MMPERIIGNQICVLIVVHNCMRTRAYERHVAFQHIDELRQLINAGCPQDLPNAGEPFVLARNLFYRVAVFRDF